MFINYNSMIFVLGLQLSIIIAIDYSIFLID